jgi:hypothetical protein
MKNLLATFIGKSDPEEEVQQVYERALAIIQTMRATCVPPPSNRESICQLIRHSGSVGLTRWDVLSYFPNVPRGIIDADLRFLSQYGMIKRNKRGRYYRVEDAATAPRPAVPNGENTVQLTKSR